jgi:hypothetical protein
MPFEHLQMQVALPKKERNAQRQGHRWSAGRSWRGHEDSGGGSWKKLVEGELKEEKLSGAGAGPSRRSGDLRK